MGKANNSPISLEKLLESYEQKHTLADYITCRRDGAAIDVRSHRFLSFDVVIGLHEELKFHKIDYLVVAGVLDGDKSMVDELCLQLMERIEARRTLESKGHKHLQSRKEAIPDTLVDFLIVFALEACEQFGHTAPSSLVILIRERLGRADPSRFEKYIVSQKRRLAISIAVGDFQRGEKVSIRRVARAMGYQPSTVKRWFTTSSLEAEVKRFLPFFEYSARK